MVLEYLYDITFDKNCGMSKYNNIEKMRTGKSTMLNREYTKLVNNLSNNDDEENETRWEVYNVIIGEFFQLDGGRYVDEIKYRFTDGEDINNILSDIISRYGTDEISHFLWQMKKRLDDFIEEDFFKRFY